MFHEFSIGDQQYRSSPLPPRQALKIAKRILPVLVGVAAGAAAFGVVIEDGKPSLPQDANGKLINPFGSLTSAAEVFARMPDADADFIIDGCLAVVQRRQGDRWAPLVANGVQMFAADLSIPVIMMIVWEVGKANLADFLNILRSLGLTQLLEKAKAGPI